MWSQRINEAISNDIMMCLTYKEKPGIIQAKGGKKSISVRRKSKCKNPVAV